MEKRLEPAGDQTVWTDVTPFLSEVCQGLGVGELVHGENFSLFEAMAALEIMDPKMDAGMTTTGFKSVEEAIECGAAPTNLSISQTLDIMDHLLSCEATWHKGHSLAQTVFSCVYMLRMDRAAENPVLYSFCKATRATCSIVRTAVAMAHTHEEEDLFTIAFGLPIDENDGDCLAILNAAEETLSRQLRVSRNKPGKKKNTEEVEPLQGNPELETGFCENALSRLRFRKAFHQVMVHMNRPQGRGLETARKYISTALSELTLLKDSATFLSSQHSHSLLETSSATTNSTSTASASTTASGREAIGFDESMNRSCLPPTPPRSMKLHSWNEALDYFKQLLHDLDRVCSVRLNLDMESLLQLIVDFQKGRPDLVARARMQLLLLQEDKLFGLQNMGDLLTKSMFPLDASFTRDISFEKFLQQAGWLVIHLIKVLCANPAWQCRKLGKILEEWNNLLHQVEVACGNSPKDVERKDSMVAWIAVQISWMAIQFIMLGFELELYALSEYCMIYWYFDHVLLTYLHYKLQTDKSSIDELDVESESNNKKKGKKEKSGWKKKATAKANAKTKELKFSRSFVVVQCLSDLCKGFIWMLVALERDEKLVHRKTEFNTEQERFAQRFELLQKVFVPAPLSYAHFKDAMKLERYSVKELYEMANEYFRAVHQQVQELGRSEEEEEVKISREERSKEIKQLEQVAVRNRVALQIVNQAGPGPCFKVSFQFSHHSCFPVAVIKNSP